MSAERIAFEHACFNGQLLNADAIVVLTGDGTTRLPTAIELFRRGGAPAILVSGGVDDPPYARSAHDLVGILLEKGVAPDRLLCEDESQHTRESAEKVVDMIEEREWGRVILTTSSYHIPRAMLTFIQVLRERELHEVVHLVPVSTSNSYLFAVPAGLGKRRIQLVEVEAAKVAEYQAKGDVASYDGGLAYLEYWEGR